MNVILPKVKHNANLRGRSANIGRPTNIPNVKKVALRIREKIKILKRKAYERPKTVFG